MVLPKLKRREPRHEYTRKNCPAARRREAVQGFQALVQMATRAYEDQELEQLLSPLPYSVRYRVLQLAGPHLSFEPSQDLMQFLLTDHDGSTDTRPAP